MPVTKSGTDSFWVLLGEVHFDPDVYQPFEIAIFQGKNKPNSLLEFLNLLSINSINYIEMDLKFPVNIFTSL